jgi:hypothetical protein
MKQFALLAATLICFAGCGRTDTDDMTATPDTTGTASGTPGTTQSGSDMNSSTINNPPPATEADAYARTNNPAQVPAPAVPMNRDTNTINEPQNQPQSTSIPSGSPSADAPAGADQPQQPTESRQDTSGTPPPAPVE